MAPNLLRLSLLLPIFSLIISPSATALSVPSPAPSPTQSPSYSPMGAPIPSSLEPSTMKAPTPTSPSPSLGPSTGEATTPLSVPTQNYISFPPTSHPPSQPASSPASTNLPSQTGSSPASTNPPSQPASSPASTNHALVSICKSTDYPNLCISTITPFLGNGPINLETVVGFAMKATVEHTRRAESLAAKLALMPSAMASVYGDCKDSYGDALDNFESAMSAHEVGDVGTMNSMLSAAITDFVDCSDGLLGRSSPLSDVCSSLSQMTSNCLAVVSLMH